LTAGGRKRRPEDSAEGCRANAKVDLAAAAGADSAHARAKFEASAASWLARAEMLARLGRL
jgi:hypothetical protein